jgi:hypothetical protein
MFLNQHWIPRCILAPIGSFNGRVLGIAPWTTYEATFAWVDANWQTTIKSMVTFPNKEKEAEFDQFKGKILRYNTVGLKTAYSVIFFAGMFFLNSSLFLLSLVFSRIMLCEMVSAGRTLTAFSLLITNIVLVGVVSSAVLLLLVILAVPALWLVVPVFLIILVYSKNISLLALAFGLGFTGAWTFGSAPLKTTVWIAFSPCTLTLIVTGFTIVALGIRRKLHSLVSAVLLRCAVKGPISVAIGLVAVVSSLVAVLAKVL